MDEIKTEFRRWQKEHPNFMTPYIRKLEVIDGVVIELSEGTGFEHEPLFGVSVRKKVDSDFKAISKIGEIEEPNKPFQEIGEAENHLKFLSEKIKECIANKNCEIKVGY